jgi:aryl-alcohol dehydrogenase-like predicted oxidoreductase
MNFGNAWKDYMGACDQSQTEKILDFFYEQGGNFIDTANNYQGEESEEWIGDWMKKRGNRDQIGKWIIAVDVEPLTQIQFWRRSSPHASVWATMRSRPTSLEMAPRVCTHRSTPVCES